MIHASVTDMRTHTKAATGQAESSATYVSPSAMRFLYCLAGLVMVFIAVCVSSLSSSVAKGLYFYDILLAFMRQFVRGKCEWALWSTSRITEDMVLMLRPKNFNGSLFAETLWSSRWARRAIWVRLFVCEGKQEFLCLLSLPFGRRKKCMTVWQFLTIQTLRIFGITVIICDLAVLVVCPGNHPHRFALLR